MSKTVDKKEYSAGIVQSLKDGFVPWSFESIPREADGKPIPGVRAIHLNRFGELEAQKNVWLSYQKAIELGGKVKEGEKGVDAIFNESIKKPNVKKPGSRVLWFMRYYTMYSIGQCDGLSIVAAANWVNSENQTKKYKAKFDEHLVALHQKVIDGKVDPLTTSIANGLLFGYCGLTYKLTKPYRDECIKAIEKDATAYFKAAGNAQKLVNEVLGINVSFFKPPTVKGDKSIKKSRS